MRPIDADALDKILADAEIEARHNKRYVLQGAINTIRGNVAKMPTIEEQKTGKWEDNYPIIVEFECLRCGNCHGLAPKEPFCCFCGAKMEER